MIELPEAITIASQMTRELAGKRVAECIRGNAPHKFAFYNREPEEYAGLFRGKTIGASREQGSHVLMAVEPGYTMALGGGGERIFLHTNEKTLPKKHQFLLRFEDGAYLTVTIQMWGMLQLWESDLIADQPYFGKRRASPLEADFTPEFFEGLFAALPPDDSRAIKFFMISQPGIWGVGNGCLQDILFRAGIHHRRKAASLRPAERDRLYTATVDTLREMAQLGGRDSELDLYGCPGRYHRILGSHTLGKPCPQCGGEIMKEAFLGGASYYCPRCQE